MMTYFWNGFLLLIPILWWNWLLADYLPPTYQPATFENAIPPIVVYGENILRFIVLALPVFMKLSIQKKIAKTGLLCYLLGISIYFASWIVLMLFPESSWSTSALGFMAPAYTPIIWLVGIGLIGHHTFIKIPYFPQLYISLSVLFVLFHTLHAYIVFIRL